ncbi:Rrf2 family transcriptional regulator [Halomonas getboli]|uniref:Rrf2 family transcriptional regulator n=1 Tax=Halomonas getboli TaxID=2935862 RepID=UPI001FFF6F09|nr:Rrf2 family transcriptional regulator [Halomonas getboli]MCK2185141.1 Rrf2 family transcriptional regulator [Halomonas getboli]
MRLTHFTDYSLRVLIYLAVKGEERATIAEIAERFAISRNHLMKVVQELNRLGYLHATRGKHGGLLLNRAPDEIPLGGLIRDIEPDLGLVECFRDDNGCVITPACRLKPILGEALAAFVAVLDRYTLADLLGQQRAELITLLNIEDAAS